MCQHRIYRMFFPPSSPVRTTLLSLLSDIFMRRILSPSFPLPLTYVCCFSCSYCCFSCPIPKTTGIICIKSDQAEDCDVIGQWSAFRSTHAFALHVWPFLIHPNFNRPIPSQKWILKQQVPLNALKAQHENPLPMYEPLPSPRQSHSQNNPKTLPGPRPTVLAASTLAPAEISCSTTAAWPY